MPAEFVRRMQRHGDASEISLDPVLGSAVTMNTHAWRLLAMSMLADAGVRIFSPEDGQRLGLPRMINELIRNCDTDQAASSRPARSRPACSSR